MMSNRGDDSVDATPRTVADLLAQYGGSSVPPGGRRRRRASDPEDTAPQAIIDRVLSDSATMRRLDEHGQPVVPSWPADRGERPPSHGAAPAVRAVPPSTTTPRATSPVRQQPPRMAPPPTIRPHRDDEPTDRFPRIEPDALNPPSARGATVKGRTAPGAAGRGGASAPGGTTAPAAAGRGGAAAARDAAALGGAATPGVAAPGGTARDSGSRYGAPPRRAEPQRRGQYQPEPDEPDWGDAPRRSEQHPAIASEATKGPRQLGTAPDAEPPARSAPARSASANVTAPRGRTAARSPAPDDDDELLDDEYDEVDEDEDLDEESPTREWLVMTSQLAIGAVGGAALWLGFQGLWQFMPLAALVVALVVITALVWIVRRIRHSDDLQTTVVTVLVGLFVTVSPAALLLLGR